MFNANLYSIKILLEQFSELAELLHKILYLY